MSLRSRILLGFGVTLALLAVVLGWAVVNLVSLGAASDAILRENYRSILAAESMVDAIERQDSGVLIALLGDPERGERLFRDAQVEFVRWLSRAQDNITIEGEAAVVARIDAGYEQFLRRARELLARVAAEDPARLHEEQLEPTFAAVRAAALELRDLNQETMQEASREANRVAARAITSTSVVGLAALVGGLLFAVFLSGWVVRPLRDAIAAARRIGEGDYHVRMPDRGIAELGELADELNGMAARLASYHQLNIERIVAEKQKSDAILRGIDDGIVMMRPDGRVTDVNRAAAELLRVDQQDVVGLPFLDLLPDPALYERLMETARTGLAPAMPEDERILTIHGGELHVSWTVTPIRTDDGGMVGVLLLLRDVTRLKELDRLKSDFVMAASHELRTPLTSIAMSVGLLREQARKALDERQRELLDAAHEEVQRLRALVTDLLDLSRIEAGRIDLSLSAESLPGLVERVEGVMRTQLAERGVSFSQDLPEDLPAVEVDPHKITWVLTNLVGNALRYVDRGGHIRVGARAGRDHVRVSVEDDGRGIPRAYQSRIFDKFVRVESENDPGGSGLGLTICREIVRAHGGTIWVESEPGAGARFTFTLPAIGTRAVDRHGANHAGGS